MKKKFLTRTQLASHFGVTVPTLKDHLLEVNACEAILKDLTSSKNERPPLVANRNSAMKILREAGSELGEYLNKDEDDEDYKMTDEIVWLSAGTMKACMFANTSKEKQELADRIEAIIEGIKRDISQGIFDANHPNVKSALIKIKAVMQWYRGGKPNVANSPYGDRPVPPKFRKLPEGRELKAEKMDNMVHAVTMPASEDEITIIRSGHTLRRNGEASGSILEAVAQACGMIYPTFSREQKINYARISVDGKKLLVSDWDTAVEMGRRQMMAAFNVSIKNESLRIEHSEEPFEKELFSIGINAADRHFESERISFN